MMVLKILVFVLYVYCNVAPSEAEAAYDLIIIPVPKAAPVRTKKHQLNYPKRNQYISNINNRNRKDDFLKLDIENYQEPTDMPDIDDLDFNNEKEESGFDTYGNYGEDKIVGGVEVDINLYPYHVAYGTNCGGAIIDKKWVITAGHCGKKPFIRVGSKYLNQGRKVDVKSYHVHPMWSAKNKEHPFDYDFQLLELKEPLKFDSNIQPVKIAHIEDMVIGKVITVTGWGNTEENGPYSTVLRAVRVPIISKENCQSVPFPYFRGGLTARMFCAGFSEGKKDACQGDSGGPAVAYDRILGMVSFGYGCATPGSYGVYSKVAKVRPWVEEVTGIKFEYILGGYNISIFKAPYQVNYGDICGGVLIHRLWSMTSAHCGSRAFQSTSDGLTYTLLGGGSCPPLPVPGYGHAYSAYFGLGNCTELYIRVGHNHRLYGSKIRIHSHVVHPKYMQDHTFDYDLQLLRHNRRLHFTLRVSAVRISYGNRGNSVVVSGWGYPKEKGDYTDVLQRVNLEIVPLDVCQSIEKPWYNHTLTDRMFCAGGAGKDACQGDSGGGAISRGKLIGISSFGYGCGRNIPGVYTNVTEEFIRKWIHFYTGV